MQTLRKIAWVEVKLLVREPLTLVFTFAFPLLVLLVLGQVFGNAPDVEQPEVFRGVGPMAALLAAAAFVTHAPPTPESVGGVLLGFAVSLACFAAIGVLLGAIMPSARA